MKTDYTGYQFSLSHFELGSERVKAALYYLTARVCLLRFDLGLRQEALKQSMRMRPRLQVSVYFRRRRFFAPNTATAPQKLVKWTMYLQLPSSSSSSFERLLTKQSFGLKKSVMESDVSHESLLKQCTRKQVSADLYATSHSLSWQQCLMQMSKSPTSPIFVKFPALRPRARVVSSRTLSAWQTGARCFLCLLPFSSGERQQINFEAVLVLDIHSALVDTLKVDSRISVFLSQRGIKNAYWATWCSNLIPVWCSRSNNRSTQSAVSWILTGDFQEVVNCPKSTEVFNPFTPKLPSYWELVV